MNKWGSITLGGQVISYLIKESKRAKNLNIKVNAVNGLEVVVPCDYPLNKVEPLLKTKEKWILEKMAVMSARGRLKPLFSEPTVLFLGKPYRLVTVFQQGQPSLELLGDKIIVILPQTRESEVKKVLEQWLRYQARCIITQRLDLIKKKLNLEYNKVFIKDQKTRWGSCSSQGNLNFNYRLVMAPLPVIDYLVTHELAHLAEMNHSKRFWSLVERVCPEYKKHRQWLKEHGSELTL